MDGRLLAEMSVLAAVVETGSFTRAAEVLGLSASGVSRSVARLEAKIGVRLLERTTRALRLTGEGTRLYELAAPHLSGIEEAADAVAGAAAQVRGVLRVSLNPLFVRYVLAPRLPEFLARHPELEIRMVPVPDTADLVAEGVDVAVRFGPQPASSMSSRLLLNTRVLTVASPAYLKRHGRPKVPQDLAGHECLQYINPQDGRVFDWEFHRGKKVLVVETRGRLTLTDGDSLVRACVAGAGIAQMLALGFESLLTGGALVDLFPDWPDETFPLYAIRPSRRLPPAAVEAFLDFCTEICRGHA
ncbi:LysR family transcriptional regulator [Massilia sp. JS1662]|nr:LysR family transcriptional regulator [Massilia sp. JS1662]KGF80286.1 LysR family transcriptional regulator [Massilia sp. JS1662]